MDAQGLEAAVAELKAQRDRAVRRATEEADEAFLAQKAVLEQLVKTGWKITPPAGPGLPPPIRADEFQEEPGAPDSRGAVPRPAPERLPSLKDAVRTFMSEDPGNFTVVNVERFLNQRWPGIMPEQRRASLSSTLIGLAREGELIVLEPGRGNRPTVYALAYGTDEEPLITQAKEGDAEEANHPEHVHQ